jgi:hypothetical protein
MDLVDLFRAGRLTVGLGAIVFAGLAAGLLGLAGGRPLGERSGLALAGAGRRVELAAEALVFGLQVTESSLKGLAAGTRDGFHTLIVAKTRQGSGAISTANQDQLELRALTNTLPHAQRQFLALSCGQKAVEALRQAVAKGYKDAANIKKDKDLDPLRQRDDFQKLLAELDEKPWTEKPGGDRSDR